MNSVRRQVELMFLYFFVVFGYKKFKGKQKEIIEAAHTGMLDFKIIYIYKCLYIL